MSIKALGALQLPSQKEWGAGIGGLIAFGVIVAAGYLKIPLSDETETLLVVVLPPLIAKLVPASDQDVLNHINDDIVAAGVTVGKLTPPAQIVAADPSNTLVLQPAKLVQLLGGSATVPLAKPSWQQQLKDDLAFASQPTSSGPMADPAVVLQPKIDPPPAPAPVPGYDPRVALQNIDPVTGQSYATLATSPHYAPADPPAGAPIAS